MGAIFNSVYKAWNEIIYAFGDIGFFDVVDILIVAYVFYKCIELFRETRSGQLIKGIVILLIVYVFSNWFDMGTVQWMLVKVFEYGIVALAVIFQPEIRRALEKVGRSNIAKLGRAQSFEDEEHFVSTSITSICKACASFSESKIGALIVFERETLLGDIIETGKVIDAIPTIELVQNIFFPKSPLHDGAAIVRAGRIVAAGCILPVSNTDAIASHYGTRHRAAIGMTEETDAIVAVVSEETGIISVAEKGKLITNLTAITLREMLMENLLPESHTVENKPILSFVKKVFSGNKGGKE